MAWLNLTYRKTKYGARIDGVFAMAFIHNDEYHLSPISVYQDGMIDCWGLVDFDEFKEKVRTGWVVTKPPQSANISVWFLGTFKARDAYYWTDPEEFIKDVADQIEELNGRPSTLDRCRDAWAAYKNLPSQTTKENLRIAYAAIPDYNRRYVVEDEDDLLAVL